jgi:chemotaxis protein CheC
MLLNDRQIDFFKDTFNMGVGKGVQVLNSMLNSNIILNVPEIYYVNNPREIFTKLEDSVSTVNLKFDGILKGDCQLLFPSESALKLVKNVTGQMYDGIETDFDAMSEGVIKEIGNIVLNSVMGVLGNTLNINLVYSVPTFTECAMEELLSIDFAEKSTVGVIGRIEFKIEAMDVEGEVLTIFKMGSFDNVLENMDRIINA